MKVELHLLLTKIEVEGMKECISEAKQTGIEKEKIGFIHPVIK